MSHLGDFQLAVQRTGTWKLPLILITKKRAEQIKNQFFLDITEERAQGKLLLPRLGRHTGEERKSQLPGGQSHYQSHHGIQNFIKLMSDTKPQIQETPKNTSRINSKATTFSYIISELKKIKDKENPEEARGKNIPYP